MQIVIDWIEYLRTEKLWGNEDPLFPASKVALNADSQFRRWLGPRTLEQRISDSRDFPGSLPEGSDLPYFHPAQSSKHVWFDSARRRCKSPEEFKAWSQNLGHEKVLTTFLNYGSVTRNRQAEIMRNLTSERKVSNPGAEAIAEAVWRKIQGNES